MSTFILRRLFQLVLVLWGTMTLMFFLFFLLPDDPANLIAGGGNKTVDEQVLQNVREKYGLDKPVIVQYAKYLKGVATFDFGNLGSAFVFQVRGTLGVTIGRAEIFAGYDHLAMKNLDDSRPQWQKYVGMFDADWAKLYFS